jgi:hypothetical protein
LRLNAFTRPRNACVPYHSGFVELGDILRAVEVRAAPDFRRKRRCRRVRVPPKKSWVRKSRGSAIEKDLTILRDFSRLHVLRRQLHAEEGADETKRAILRKETRNRKEMSSRTLQLFLSDYGCTHRRDLELYGARAFERERSGDHRMQNALESLRQEQLLIFSRSRERNSDEFASTPAGYQDTGFSCDTLYLSSREVVELRHRTSLLEHLTDARTNQKEFRQNEGYSG